MLLEVIPSTQLQLLKVIPSTQWKLLEVIPSMQGKLLEVIPLTQVIGSNPFNAMKVFISNYFKAVASPSTQVNGNLNWMLLEILSWIKVYWKQCPLWELF